MSRIIIKNLPPKGVDQEDIKKHFADIDNITDVTLKYNDFGTFRRFAFVGFKSEDAAQKAVEKLNNTFLKNNRIALEQCKTFKDVQQEKSQHKQRHFAARELNDAGNVKVENSDNPRQKSLKRKRLDVDEDGDGDDEFDKLKDDPEFKEFLMLQRNVGENSKSKQIWADDAKLDAEHVDIPKADTKTQKSDMDGEVKPPVIDGDEKPKKKHKRSRGKKNKPSKTKPDELFVHTIKIQGCPKDARRKDIMDFFKPLKALSVRLCKRDEVCYVSFKDESDLKYALRKDQQFLKTSRVKLSRHNVHRSRVFKEQVREKVQQKEDTFKKYETELKDVEPVGESGRLFVRNLNYTCTQDDLEQVFSKFGKLTEIHMPIDKTTSMPKGFAYVEFMFPADAAKAHEELNGTIFQGRNFHLIPSKPKPEPALGPDGQPWRTAISQPQSSFKREKLEDQKKSAPKGNNWNILFLGQNALADVISENKGVEKSELLTQHSRKEPLAVKMALGDAQVVDEMRRFLVSNGVELDSFDNAQAPRSRTVIIVKNLPASTERHELVDLFSLHGRVGRVILPPNGLTAIVEMEEPTEAKIAFKKLAYGKFKDTILYLEWAPINVFREKSLDDQEVADLKQMEQVQTGTKILVKNIPFEATLPEVKKIFAAYGNLNFVRLPKKIDGQHRGFGFIDYLTKEDALRAFRALCHSTHLYGRKLVLQWAQVDESKVGGSDDKQ